MNDIGKCPVCHAWVRSPAEAVDSGDRLQCPACSAEYPAAQWRSLDLPTLRLLRTAAANTTNTAAAADDIPEPGSVPWESLPNPSEPFEMLAAEDSIDAESARLDAAASAVAVSDPPDELEITASLGETDTPAIEIRSPFVNSSKARRRPASPLRELAKIAAGGAAGLVIAQLILWWLPAPYRRDPFRLAPQIPGWLQFALPGELQTAIPRRVLTPRSRPLESAAPLPDDPVPDDPGLATDSNPFNDETRPSDAGSSDAESRPAVPDASLPFSSDDTATVTPDEPNDFPREADATPTQDRVAESPITMQPVKSDINSAAEHAAQQATAQASDLAAWQTLDPSDSAILDTFIDSNGSAATNPKPADLIDDFSDSKSSAGKLPAGTANEDPTDALAANDPKAQEFTALGAPPTPSSAADLAPRTGLFYSGVELQTALSRALSSLDTVQQLVANTPREQRAEAARLMYQRLCDVAQIVAYVDVNDRQLGQRMNAADALLARVAKDASLLNLVGRTAGDWIAFPSRTSDGIAVAGEIMRIDRAGPYFESVVKLRSRDGNQMIRLLSTTPPDLDPRTPYGVGQHILALGSIVVDPESTLPAYQSSGPVIWRSLHVVLAP